MTPERWKKLDALFHEAMELQRDARAAHLANVCGDDVAVARRLLAEARVARGDLAGAEIELKTALDLLRKYPSSPTAWKIHAALGRLRA